MMHFIKTFYSFIILFSCNYINSQSIPELRGHLSKGENSLAETKILLQKSENAYSKTNQPIYLAFLAVGNFFMAKHSKGVSKKMDFFSKGKKLMADAVKNDPNNLEIRLMRLISQEKLPSLLFYKGNISEDKKFLKENYQKTNDHLLKVQIKSYLKL